jgi:hypothetical protein
MAAGCYLRLAPLQTWLDHKERYFFDNRQVPLMVTVDSYFYLDIAKELQEGTFSSFDPHRFVPVGHNRPSTPPLLSVLLARLSTLSGIGLNGWRSFYRLFLALFWLFLPILWGFFLRCGPDAH